jgi:SAM-dependent methyltransferase
MKQLLEPVKRTLLHPQWLSLRYQYMSRRWLQEISGCRVLDIGSGDSRHESLLGPGCTLYRLDYPATSRRYRLLPDIFADAGNIPVSDCMADVVLLLEVLEHLPDDRKALHEIHRVLKPGGKLYLSVPFIYPVHDAPTDYRRYTMFGLESLLENCGFKVVQGIRHGNSIVTTLHQTNMVLLEIARDLYKLNRISGFITAALFYPFCVLVNLTACPFLLIKKPDAACLGYFTVAIRQ